MADMPRVVASIHISAPAEVAFDFVADPSTARLIDPAIREYRPDTVPMREGTTTLIRFRMFGLPVRATSVVRAWEPGRRMVMENTRPSRPVRVTGEHRFEPDDDGDGCTYTWAIDCAPVGLLGRPAASLMARFWRANADAQQINVKREVEAHWSATGGSAT
jgi:hypothetical protein